MIRASKLIQDTMTRFGLIMHVGVLDGGKLKTEAMHHPLTLEEVSTMKNETPGAEEAKVAVNEGCTTFNKDNKKAALLTP
jgi:hypothetical protein